MLPIKLKRLLFKKAEYNFLNELIKTIAIPFMIEDPNGVILKNHNQKEIPGECYPISVVGETIGWVTGGEKVFCLVHFIVNLMPR